MIRYHYMYDGKDHLSTEIIFDKSYILSTPFEQTKDIEADTEKYREYFYKQLRHNEAFKNEVIRLIDLYEKKHYLDFYSFYRSERCYLDVVKECIFYWYKKRLAKRKGEHL